MTKFCEEVFRFDSAILNETENILKQLAALLTFL